MSDTLAVALARPCRVLVVGDAMLDTYILGAADRISPEAPVPVLKVTGRQHHPGGAGNVAMNLVGLGATVTVVAITGMDPPRDTLATLLSAAGVEFLACAQQRPTTRKTRIVSGRQQLVRIDEEDDRALNEGEWAALRDQLQRLPWANFDVVVISDYGKGVCTAALCEYVIGRSREVGAPVLVDPSGADWSRYGGAWLVTPNLRELALAYGQPVPNESLAVRASARAVGERFGLEALLVTRAEQGMTLVSASQEAHMATAAREVFDVSGAGDTVVAVVARLVGAHGGLEAAVHAANRAAGVVIARHGTYPIRTAELLAATASGAPMDKVVERRDVARLAEALATAGQRSVFTNGVFDILHPGHVALLRRAAELGDCLIVGLNGDASTARLKGPGRPVHDQQARVQVLTGLAAVDYVIVFDEDTPAELLKVLRPDVLVKGGDYAIEEVVGREYAGETRILPFVAGHSTTSILEKR